ncbi:hypothetical protein FQN60_010606 [Etheostoma spectabile]|uniref:Thyroglobulin type-1 domain-containing protein n=1 Tax=Etheostoma spectabile TaxID=54343 RepID=A0A5J5CA89_9PERO|nr:hypothetical protein FQN60_010606 [Etheostoma spectabile]
MTSLERGRLLPLAVFFFLSIVPVVAEVVNSVSTVTSFFFVEPRLGSRAFGGRRHCGPGEIQTHLPDLQEPETVCDALRHPEQDPCFCLQLGKYGDVHQMHPGKYCINSNDAKEAS